MNPNSIRIANQRLYKAHPELAGRPLTLGPEDEALRREWRGYYAKAEANTPPKPSLTPSPAAKPVSASIVAPCPAIPPKINVSKCSDVKNHVQEGDIVLRGERGDTESEMIANMSGCEYSHAGIVAKNAKGELVVVDAYPGRGKGNANAVAETTVDDFFCGHKATQGLVSRPKDCDKAKIAAEWAMKQTADPDYVFDLFDPWNVDNKKLYCSDFVTQSFKAAGVDLVPVKTDFLDAAHKANTIKVARQFAKEDDWKAGLAPDSKIEKKLLERSGGNTSYITPCQAAKSSSAQPIVVFEQPKPAAPARSTGNKF